VMTTIAECADDGTELLYAIGAVDGEIWLAHKQLDSYYMALRDIYAVNLDVPASVNTLYNNNDTCDNDWMQTGASSYKLEAIPDTANEPLMLLLIKYSAGILSCGANLYVNISSVNSQKNCDLSESICYITQYEAPSRVCHILMDIEINQTKIWRSSNREGWIVLGSSNIIYHIAWNANVP